MSADYYVVERAPGPSWDRGRPRREQQGWNVHAAFMDRLVEEGFLVLGGPIGDAEDDPALHVIAAPDEATVRARLAEDPWGEDMLTTVSVRPWHVWLRAPGNG